MKIIKHIIIVFTCLIPTYLIGGGPAYTRFGIGDLGYFASSRSFSMGGSAIALTGDGFINRLNPAGISKISHTRLSGSFGFRSYSTSESMGSTNFARGEFQGLAVAIPISAAHGSVITADATPLSTVHYDVEQADSKLGIASQQRVKGTGGLSSYSLGSSFFLSKDFSVGAKINYLYGKVNRYLFVDFDDPAYTDSEIRRANIYRGVNFTIGSQYSGIPNLTLGLILMTPTKLTLNKEYLLFTNIELDTVKTTGGKSNFPMSYGFGFSYLLNNSYVLAVDLLAQEWSKANFLAVDNVQYRNSLKVGIGFEALPKKDANKYWDQVIYRGGFGYNASYLKIRNEPINEYFVSGGISLPIGPDVRLNIGVQAGTRGTTAQSLQKDNFLRLSFTLSASEQWFLKFEED